MGRLSRQAGFRIPLLSLVTALMAFVGDGKATAEQIGPSFDCKAAQQPLAQTLCSDADLSRTDLRFAQAYYALLKQVGEATKRELKQEDLQFLEAVQRKCGIPTSGPSAPQSEASRNCVKSAYEAQRAVWVLRLTSPFSEEANRPIERHVALQRSLQQLGFLPAEALIDGVYGAGTREAISKWQTAKGRSVMGILGDADAQALEEQASQRATPETANASTGSKPGETAGMNAEKPSASAEKVGPPADKQATLDTPVGIGTQAAAPQETTETETGQSGPIGLELNADDVKRIVDEVLNRQPYVILLLGNITVYGGLMAGPPGVEVQVPSGNNITAQQYDDYKLWAQLGVIKLTSQGPLSQQSGWGNYLALMRGVQERIIVTPACKDGEICRVVGNTLKIKASAYKAENVIKDEERTIGVHRYRIVMGTYSVKRSPISQSFCRLRKSMLFS